MRGCVVVDINEQQAAAQDERVCMSDHAPLPEQVPYPPSKDTVAINNSYGPMSLEPHEGEPVEHLYGMFELRDYGARCIAWDRATRLVQTEQQAVEVMLFQLKHPDTGDAHTVVITRSEIADGMDDTIFEKLGDLICDCFESVSTTLRTVRVPRSTTASESERSGDIAP